MDRSTLLEDELEAKRIIDYIVAIFHAMQANPNILALERAFPAAASLAAEFEALIPHLGQIEMAVGLLIEYGPTLYALAQAAGVHPADGDELAKLSADRERGQE